MFYQNLPLYLKLINLLNLLKSHYQVVHNLPKEYKYSLGEDIIKRNWELLDLFIAAQTSLGGGGDAKNQTINQLSTQYDSFKIRVRFLSELKLISLNQAGSINAQLAEIGKMIGSWLKNA